MIQRARYRQTVNMARIVTLAWVVSTLAGDRADAGASAAPVRAELRIVIAADAQRGATRRTFTLRCGPARGDWPAASRACRRLRDQRARRGFAPIRNERRDVVRITDQPVRISGTIADRRVALVFGARGSSTRRARFAAVRRVLGRRAFRRAERDARG